MTTRTYQIALPIGLVVDLAVNELGEGSPILLLHGGGGSLTVATWADQLAQVRPARVMTPTHPGFDGTLRPDGLRSIRDLAALYVELLRVADLNNVTVVGNSIGGWIAAEMAILASPRVASYVLIDAVGIEVPGHPVVDFFSLTSAEVAQRSYHDPARYAINPADLEPAARQAMAANRETLRAYGGTSMTDPSLAARLHEVTQPSLVVWGESDQIGDVDFGKAYAAAIPSAEFRLLLGAGHMPQIEAPASLIEVVWDFAARHFPHAA